MTERTMTAMYDTKGAAESARDGLVALGVPSAEVTIRGTEDGGSGATSTSSATEDKGFWSSLADLFAPDEDRYTYAEGVRRGGYLLTARVPEGLEDQAARRAGAPRPGRFGPAGRELAPGRLDRLPGRGDVHRRWCCDRGGGLRCQRAAPVRPRRRGLGRGHRHRMLPARR